MKTPAFLAAFAAAGLWISPVADAATIEITAYATITSTASNVPSYMQGYQSPFVLGDQLIATLTYDTDATYGTVPMSGSPTGYFPATGVLTTGTGWSDSAWSYFNVGTSDITFKGQYGDGRYTSGFPLFAYTATLSFSDPFATIPPEHIDPSTFLSGMISGLFAQTPYLDSSFTARVDRITALATPIPGAALLFSTALAALAAYRLRRRTSAQAATTSSSAAATSAP